MNVITPDFSQKRPNTEKTHKSEEKSVSEIVTPEKIVNVSIGSLNSKFSPSDLFLDTNYKDFLPRLDEEGFLRFIDIVEGSNWIVEGFNVGDKVKVKFHSFKPGANFGELNGFCFYVNKKFIFEKR